jgi:hypothetical protein
MNSSWPDTRDVCKEFTCHQDSDGEVEIQIKRENCNTDCPKVQSDFIILDHVLTSLT